MLAGRIGLSNIRTRISPLIRLPHPHPFKPHPTTSIRQIATFNSPPSWPPLSTNESLTHKLPDGRTLGFSTYGPDTGYPILIFHGLPGSRIDARGFQALDPGFGLRIIGIDRPGFGLSSPQHSRTLTDWPTDVRSLVKHLGLKEFKVLGTSGGGPYALACAHACSTGKLTGLAGTGVLYGLGPLEAGLHGMNFTQWLGWKLIPYLPLAYVRFMQERFIARHVSNPDPKPFEDAIYKILIKDLKPEEKDIMLRPDIWREFTDSLREAFIQGADGHPREAALLSKRWDFDLQDVDARVLLWWGTADDLAPVSMGRWMAERLRNAKLREFEGETHWTLQERYGKEILRELVEA